MAIHILIIIYITIIYINVVSYYLEVIAIKQIKKGLFCSTYVQLNRHLHQKSTSLMPRLEESVLQLQ
jgi:hypothetical protein